MVITVAGLVAAAGATTWATRATADPVLPPLTAEELLVRVAGAELDGLSATFEQRSDLGLPEVPTSVSGAADLQDALALLAGDHTVRVWLSGPELARAALVDGSTETAMIRNGDDVWLWSSEDQKAVHSVVPERGTKPSGAPTSPTEAIRDLLAEVEPTTDVATSGTGYVAGRPVYQLQLTPRDDDSLVGQVRVAVDAQEFVPLGLRVIADDGSDAITISASSVDFTRPDDAVFAFTPPPGAEVEEADAPRKPTTGPTPGERPTIVGTGWTAVAVAELDQEEAAEDSLSALLESLPRVSGTWGSGRLLRTTLVNAVLTDDGRVAVGSVAPERLYAALAAR